MAVTIGDAKKLLAAAAGALYVWMGVKRQDSPDWAFDVLFVLGLLVLGALLFGVVAEARHARGGGGPGTGTAAPFPSPTWMPVGGTASAAAAAAGAARQRRAATLPPTPTMPPAGTPLHAITDQPAPGMQAASALAPMASAHAATPPPAGDLGVAPSDFGGDLLAQWNASVAPSSSPWM